MKPAIVAIAIALTGCAMTEKPPVEVRIQERVVTVQAPCPVTIPERPATLRAEDLPDDARDALRVAVGVLLGWQAAGGYGDRAEAALRICAGDSTAR